jgi:hypothetical protein
MKLKKRLACFLCLALAQLAAVAHAETWHTARIKDVYPLGNGSLVLIFVVDAAGCTGAGPGKYHYISAGQAGVNTDGVRLMAATALMAFASDKPVSVAYDETSASCYINRLLARG